MKTQEYRNINKILSILFIASLVILYASPAYALQYNCSNFDSQAASGEAPSPIAIICIIARLLNVAILLVGLVFVYVVAYSTIKLSMSFGDPKGFQGAQKTWLYAVIGALVVSGFFAAFMILASFTNYQGILSPNMLLNRLEEALISLMTSAGITHLLD